MEKYLDITKSVIISSPAGSGKTEKLARRYISLLLGGSEIEKILCITFTEKAASEMKERIMKILEKENLDLFFKIREKMPLMRISTIHAFCFKVLKRFSMELGLDPSLDVMDEFNASLLWSESVYESLIEEKDSPDLFFEMMKNRGIKGWDKVFSILNTLYAKRPISELLLRSTENENNPPFVKGGQGGIKEGVPGEFSEEKRILELYSKCLEQYKNKKLERHLLDFDDLELLAYEAIAKNTEWQNILYSFDEHTDHILVDEFQDTSSLQWKIIDKLTEEWRSGIGSKRDSGKTPTIFLVGDEKQSIYLFRGANVSVFQEAKERFSEWLGREYHFEEVRENYRSLPAIINFTNNLFERLMPPTLYESWRTRYAPFEATRQGDGRVELILIDAAESIKENREKEASALAKRIQSLIGHYEIFDGEIKRHCAYGDMAILLRKRTHLATFEDALRREGIPFIVVKGIGFYDEPEVAALRELLSFIIDTMDDYSLFCVLRSPFFGIDYETLFELIHKGDQPLIEKIQSSTNKKVKEAFNLIIGWIEKSKQTPLAVLIEDALSETGCWRYYWEKQRHANIKKFIKLIEQYESQGFSCLDIREKLIRARQGDEGKANINTEGMNAVKIMTVHAAKGLQFPMVFLPSLDENNVPKSSHIVINEDGGRISIAYEEDSTKRKKIEHFLRRRKKEIEEEKRLFYVAVTRARDFLCMLGALKREKPPTGRLAYIADTSGILKDGQINPEMDILKIMNESQIDEIYFTRHPSPVTRHLPSEPFMAEPIYTGPIAYEPILKWRDVTEDIDIRVKHGEDWLVLGRVFHRLFEELSKGVIHPDEIEKRSIIFLRDETPNKGNIERLKEIITKNFEKIEKSGFLRDVILPKENSHAELPFMLQRGNTIFRGRVDRIVVKDDMATIYDYKTFPIKDSELPELTEKYRFQMEIYRSAVEKILSVKAKSYLFFTHAQRLIEL